PARHDMSRRMDATHLAGLVAEHRLRLEDAQELVATLPEQQPREVFRLGAAGEEKRSAPPAPPPSAAWATSASATSPAPTPCTPRRWPAAGPWWPSPAAPRGWPTP